MRTEIIQLTIRNSFAIINKNEAATQIRTIRKMESTAIAITRIFIILNANGKRIGDSFIQTGKPIKINPIFSIILLFWI
jgi:hypothetical protein